MKPALLVFRVPILLNELRVAISGLVGADILPHAASHPKGAFASKAPGPGPSWGCCRLGQTPTVTTLPSLVGRRCGEPTGAWDAAWTMFTTGDRAAACSLPHTCSCQVWAYSNSRVHGLDSCWALVAAGGSGLPGSGSTGLCRPTGPGPAMP